jgi:lysozyme family protein
MADFLTAHNRTVKFEGGYQCDPDDNGNWTGAKKGIGRLIGTKYGITASVLAAYMKKEPSVDDMKNLDPDVARMIYFRNYWSPIRGNEIQKQDEANIIYDSAVNMGVGTAIILAQRSLGLHETGIMDEITVQQLNGKK